KLLSLILLFFSPIVLGNTIWSGKNVDLNISWTSNDIIVTKAGNIIFSAKKLAKQDFEADFVADNSLGKCSYEREFTLLSVVGNIASFKETEYVNCASMPRSSTLIKYVARDITSGNKIQLTDFFNESDLVKALTNDSLIKTALSKTDPTISSTRISDIVNNLRNKGMAKINNSNRLMLDGLYKALEWSEIMVKGCGYRVAKDFLNQFAFHHLNRNRVAIRLNLLPNNSDCQTKNIQLGLYLPIPTSMKAALKNADKEKVGFLMSKAVQGQTKMSFVTKPKTPTTQSLKNAAMQPVVPETSQPDTVEKSDKPEIPTTQPLKNAAIQSVSPDSERT
ncbi:hypothetical protein QUF50_10245, partial [Thiotrichales bacterium HSG1]|nr:hypothetical protein [Thiotrichales bacterium HSG1]